MSCAKETIPEGLLAAGLYSAILNPMALVVSIGYYGNSLYKCSNKFEEKKSNLDLISKIFLLEDEVKKLNIAIENTESRVKLSEENSKKYVDESIGKVSSIYEDTNKMLFDNVVEVKDKQEILNKSLEDKIKELNEIKDKFLKEIEVKSDIEKKAILETGDDSIKKIYEELRKIADSEVKFEKKVDDKEVSEEKERTTDSEVKK